MFRINRSGECVDVRVPHGCGGAPTPRTTGNFAFSTAGSLAEVFGAGAPCVPRWQGDISSGRFEHGVKRPAPVRRTSRFRLIAMAPELGSAPDGTPAPVSGARDIHLFAGQGDFPLAPLLRAGGRLRSILREVYEEVDLVSARHGLPLLGPWLLGPEPPRGRELARAPVGVAQLALFGASLAVHSALRESFGLPDALVGVSFGEIAALTAAGAFDVSDGAEIAWELARILTGTCPGGLTLLGCGESAGHALLSRSGAQNVAVACINDEEEIAVSGATDQLQLIEKAAAEQEILAVRLRLPFSSHHPALQQQATEFARAVRRHPVRPTTLVVVSAVARRHYTPSEDLPARLADCLVLPAHVPDAINTAVGHTLPGQPVRVFEAGTGSALSRNVRRVLAGRAVTVHAPLADPDFSW